MSVNACTPIQFGLLRQNETVTRKKPVETVGLVFLIVALGSPQIILPLWKDAGRFASPTIANFVSKSWCNENPIRIGRIDGPHPKGDRWTGSEWHESRTGCEKPHRSHAERSITSPTNEVFLGCAALFVTAVVTIWLAPKPARITGPSLGH